MTFRGVHVTLTAVLALFVGAAVVFLLLSGHGSQALDTWLASGKQEVQTIHGLVQRHQAYVKRTSAAQKHWSDSVGALLGRLQVEHDAAAAALASAKTSDQLREAARVLAVPNTARFNALTLCKAHADSLFSADSAHADSLAQGLRRADTTIARGIKVRGCYLVDVAFVHVACPSWQAAAVTGAVGGVGLWEWVKSLVRRH